ncbi:MAG: DUF1232 domain-containing protein [Saprospiraceae bacterium]|nr:DUF1232 domain-containing protein [Saprospiraceae bacterium]
MKNPFRKYETNFSVNQFWQKIGAYAKQAGLKTIYSALLLFYAFRRKDTPLWAKHIVVGVLGYFISPFDAIPDLTPFLGYTDDIGVLSFGLVAIAMYIDAGVRENARKKLASWFPNPDEAILKEVDERI